MNGIADIYTEEIHGNINMYAAWPPGDTLSLGDYGVLIGNRFERKGNVNNDFGVSYREKKYPSTSNYKFASLGKVQTVFKPKAQATLQGIVNILNASLDINFSDSRSVFFNAANCSQSLIDNIEFKLAKEIISLYKKGKWNPDWVIVSKLISADSTTAIISGSGNASISLEASTPQVPMINLADASIGLTSKSEKDIGFSIITQGGLTPLFGLLKLKKYPLDIMDPTLADAFSYVPNLNIFRTSDILQTSGEVTAKNLEIDAEMLILSEI